ncbi:hypothetical protein [Marinicella sp. W31]|uniref:hypothetical protein n=1 Tax=Marinicella sp. W31 TaxID=3023713 RepID=UPI003756FD6D
MITNRSLLSVLLILLTGLLVKSGEIQARQVDQEQWQKSQGTPEFIRVKRASGVQEALQVAIVSYKKVGLQDSDVVVDLVGAVHVGDKAYYADLNARFEDYDAVLYELVAPEGTRIPKGGGETSGLIGNLQLGMKNLLGLSYQLQEIDYTPAHFEHADMSPDEFKQSMEDRGESFFSMFLKMWAAGMAQQASGGGMSDLQLLGALFSSNRQGALKSLMAEQFTDMEGMMVAIEGKEGSTLVTDRNKKALEVLSSALKKTSNKRIAIFYGAAHMPDFHERLVREFNMQPVQVDWVDAWNLKQ